MYVYKKKETLWVSGKYIKKKLAEWFSSYHL